MDKILLYIASFLFYSFIGWVLECIYCSVSETRKAKETVIVNRGFLVGPLCPIYGCATTVMSLSLQPFSNNLWIVFFLGILVCDIVEYLTSLIMEKIFNARWWDYSNRFMNINGRICLQHSIIWGALSVIFIRFINPSVTQLILKFPQQYFNVFVYILLALFIVDFFIAVVATIDINNIRSKIRSVRSASYESVDVEVVDVGSSGNNNLRERLSEFKLKINSISFLSIMHIKRILRDSPNLRIQIKAQLDELKDAPIDIKDELKDIQEEIKKRFLYDDDDLMF